MPEKPRTTAPCIDDKQIQRLATTFRDAQEALEHYPPDDAITVALGDIRVDDGIQALMELEDALHPDTE